MHSVWIEGMRISTVATLVAFGLTGLVRGGDMRALWSAAAWLGGFEIAYQTTAVGMGTCKYPAAAPYFIVIGVVFVWLARKRAIRPAGSVAVLVALTWAVWIAFGFHANQVETPASFNVLDEVLNETAKILWAFAYLMPLWKITAAPRAAKAAEITVDIPSGIA